VSMTTAPSVDTTTTTTSTTSNVSRATSPLWRAGVVSGLVAAAATTAIAAAADASGHALAVGGEQIPLLGFAQLTIVGALLGLALAAVINRRAVRPRRTFVITTVVLTAASLVPDAVADASALSKLLLMTTHLVAAAIIVPALARRLRED
jgi:peptidoglycan/LPS O-acetylase OafA/YrhL